MLSSESSFPSFSLLSFSPYGIIDFDEINKGEKWKLHEIKRKEKFSRFPATLTKIDDKMKKKIRKGIPCELRRNIWFRSSGGMEVMNLAGDQWEAITAKAGKLEIKNGVYTFGSQLIFENYLPGDASKLLNSFLNVVHSQNQYIYKTPIIVPVSLFLLLFMEPSLAYLSIQGMINKTRMNETSYFLFDGKQVRAQADSVDELLEKVCKPVLMHSKSLDFSIPDLLSDLLPNFFLPYTSLTAALTIFDSYVLEGRKVLTRVLLGLFISNKDKLLATKDATEFGNVILRACAELDNPDILDYVLTKSFNLSLSRDKDMVPAENRAMKLSNIIPRSVTRVRRESMCPSSVNTITSCRIDCANMKPLVSIDTLPMTIPAESNSMLIKSRRLVSVLKGIQSDTLLSFDMFLIIQKSLPFLYRHRKAKMTFSLLHHGTTFSSFLSSAPKHDPSILLVKTTNGLFGALISDPLIVSPRKYYGRSFSFVFDANSKMIYRPESLVNSLFVHLDHQSLMIGGPRPAIFLEDGFKKMMGEACETFDSPSFVKNSGGDLIYDVQLYTLSNQ
ncbi:TLD family protein [Tritrichomonas foetus]|uniref:TLD family protein n=1 Tax=Tritrichomonas foetus TaxID=1144522 RepID=A0A1J4J8D7_9EUKA|nr:TLD family protein [Tritrichomonas foetus]|eukprot:OHS93669.1 TLD family protein [Tritrichomonas foetus]